MMPKSPCGGLPVPPVPRNRTEKAPIPGLVWSSDIPTFPELLCHVPLRRFAVLCRLVLFSWLSQPPAFFFFSCRPLVLVSLSVLPTPHPLPFSLFFDPDSCRNQKQENAFWLYSSAAFPLTSTPPPHPPCNCSFPQYSRSPAASLFSSLARDPRGVGAAGNGEGWAGQALAPRSASLSPPQDQAMGNRLPDSHHRLHKYYFHVA